MTGFPNLPKAPMARQRRILWARLRQVRWTRLVLLSALALVAALVFGVTTASANLSIGPHEARYDVTTDDLITLDLGPIGTVQIDSPLPLTLGARVTVKEIPADVRAVNPVRTLTALSSDLQGYVQFFAAPQATATDAGRALIDDALVRAGLAFLVLVGTGVVGRALLGAPRRVELAALLAPHRRSLVGTGLLVALIAVTSVSSLNTREPRPAGQPASSVFDGSALQGARITGRLAGVIDTYGGQVIEAYRANQRFYTAADDAVVAEWKARAAVVAARERVRALFGHDPGLAPPVVPRSAEPVVILLVSDLHCNVGMSKVIGSVARLSGTDLVLDAGDSTVDGTEVEQYCITTFAGVLPDGVPAVVSTGNHDSATTAAQERRAGLTVLSGEAVTAAGVRILGDRDPNQTRIVGGTLQRGTETADQEGARLARTACKDADVDLLLIHTPDVGDAALAAGCVPVQLSGHTHLRAGPAPFGRGVRYVSASTAGAVYGQPTIGPLHGTAEMTILRFDPTARRVLDYQIVAVRPDGGVSVGDRTAFPAPAPEPFGETIGPATTVAR